MIYFTPFHARHVRRIVGVQSEQAEDEVFAIELGEAEALAQAGRAWTAWIGADVVGCAGLTPVWSGRTVVWALIGERCGPHMLAITRFVSTKLAECEDRRIEATVLTGFEAGERWVRMLGFELETPGGMRNYDTAGRTMSLYSRCRP